MKYLKLLFLLYCTFLSFLDLQAINYQQPKRVIVAGKIENRDKNLDYVNIILNRVGVSNLIEDVTLDSCGSFHLVLESYISSDIQIKYKTSFFIVAHPGDSVYVTFDGRKQKCSELLKTVRFSGTNAISNKNVVQVQEKYYASSLYNDKVLKQRELNRQNINLEEFKLDFDKLYNNIIRELNPNKEVAQWAKTFIYSDYIQALPDSDDLLLNYMPKSEFELICSSKINILADKLIDYTLYKSKKQNKEYKGELVVGELMKVMEQFEMDFVYRPIRYLPAGLFQQVVFSKLFQKELQLENYRLFKKYQYVVDSIVTEPFLYYPLVNEYNKLIKELTYPDKRTEREYQCYKARLILQQHLKRLK